MNMQHETSNVGLGLVSPSGTCTDKKCPFHGLITVKPETFVGKVIRKDTHRTATIEWERFYPVPKYERFEKRRSRLRVHNPPCLNAQIGDLVMVVKTRPLSKTKNFVVVKIVSGVQAQ